MMYVQWDSETNTIIQGPQGTPGAEDNWYPLIIIGEVTHPRLSDVRYEFNEQVASVVQIATQRQPTYDLLRGGEYQSVVEQLDKLWHDIENNRLDKTGQFYMHRKAVEDLFPKEGA